MAETDDELLQRLPYLREAVWSWAEWTPPSHRWDHDHCAVCWARFTIIEVPGEAPLREGYTARGPAGEPKYHWLCAHCLQAHRELFDWSLSA